MITEFENYLISVKGYSQHTATAYGKDVRAFAHYVRETRENARWSTIGREEVDGFMAKMTAEGKTPATINRHVSSIRAIYRYFIRQGLMKTNPMRYASRKKQEKKQPRTIPTEDLVTATEHASGTLRIMLLILCTTGCRIQEMLDINAHDINQEEQTIIIHGKGKKERKVFATPEELKEIKAYAEGRPGKIFGDIDQRTVRHYIWEHLKRYSSAPQLSPHAIRHTLATNMAKHGANVTTISKLLGHENISTTQKYIDMSQQDIKAAAMNYRILN